MNSFKTNQNRNYSSTKFHSLIHVFYRRHLISKKKKVFVMRRTHETSSIGKKKKYCLSIFTLLTIQIVFLWENILLQQQINNQAIYHETRKPLHVADKGSHTQPSKKVRQKYLIFISCYFTNIPMFVCTGSNKS